MLKEVIGVWLAIQFTFRSFLFFNKRKDFEVNIEKLDSVLLNSKKKIVMKFQENITIISNEGHEMTLFDDVKKYFISRIYIFR